MAQRPSNSTMSDRRITTAAQPKFAATFSKLTIRPHLRVIGERSREKLYRLEDDRGIRKVRYNPSALFDVCLAFQAIGISIPHALFAKQRGARRPGELNRLLALPDSERKDAVREYLSLQPQYIVADDSDNDWEWCRLYPEREPTMVGFADVEHHYRHLTWPGQLSQWNYLVSLASAEAKSVLLELAPVSGRIASLGTAEQENIILATTEREPIYAVECLDRRSPVAERYLSRAGFAVVAWANATHRLLTFYESLEPEQRLQLRATTQLLTDSKPVLEWTESDRSLVDEVRRELFAVSDWWGDRSVTAKRPKRVATPRITLNEVQSRVLGELASRGHSMSYKDLSEVLGVNYDKLRKNVQALAQLRPQLVKRGESQKSEWALTDDGVIHVNGQSRENAP